MSHFLSVISFFFLAGSALASERLLFVAPHPDDEVLGMGAQIWSAQQNIGGGVADYRVVLMTCGDAYDHALDVWKTSGDAQDLNHDGKIDYLDLGIARCNETLKGLKVLGVPADKVIFLGYPDGGLTDMANSRAVYQSPLTHVSSVPYEFAYHSGAPYTAESVLSDLTQIVKSFNPTVVYSTTPTDTHPDHSETREFVKMALQLAGGHRTHLEYLIHWEQNEPGWPHSSPQWSAPQGHIPADIEVSLRSLGMKRSLKLDAIEQYVTQVASENGYIEQFAKNSEVFWYSREKLSDYLPR